jgi:hypothetical protein
MLDRLTTPWPTLSLAELVPVRYLPAGEQAFEKSSPLAHHPFVHGRTRIAWLLLICAMAMPLLTRLGAAGESLGMDRMLNANTVKTRTHSLFRQGCHYYAAIPAMKQELLEPLVQRSGEYVLGQSVYVHAFGLK